MTWNCCRGGYDANLGRLRALRPDVAVLQECGRPAREDRSAAWFGPNPRQGVAVVVRPPLRVSAEPMRPGTASFFAARVRGPVSFTVLAVWAQREPTYSEALRRGVEVYRDLLLAGPCVIMGDLNSSVAWDDRHRRTDHRRLDAQLSEEFGLVSAYHAATGEGPGQESRPTHFWRWHAGSPFHLDYCYLPKRWLPGLESATVGSYEEWADASDHRPLVVNVSPPAGPAPAARSRGMAAKLQVGDCVRVPDGRIGRVRARTGRKLRIRVRRTTSRTHQFLLLSSSELRRVPCPPGWMSPEGYRRYLRPTLAKMRARMRAKKKR